MRWLFALAKGDLPTPAPSFALQTAAQITEQSRVGKLACQRGGEGCSVAARQRTSAGRSPKGAPRTCATGSRVQPRFLFYPYRSEATTCIKTSTRYGAKWLTLYEKYDIINSAKWLTLYEKYDIINSPKI